ncbi:hypothetical protein DRQ26_02385, partial [bacterium]
TPVIPLELDEIAYEDGSGGSADEAEQGDMISVRFTPTERCSLISAKFYGYAMYPGINIQVVVYPDNGYGKPDIFSPLSSPVTCEITTGWQEVDLSTAGLVFDPYEDFHIGIKKIANVDTFPHYIFIDTDDSTGRSWWYDYSMFGFHGIGGDLEIRALVYNTSGLMRWLPDEKQVSAADGEGGVFNRHTVRFLTEDIDHYVIYRNTVPDLSSMSYLAMTSDTFYTDNDVSEDATYYYAVKAVYSDGGGISDFSNIASATTHSGAATTYLDTIILDDGTFDASATWTVEHGFGTVLNPSSVGLLRTLMFYLTNTGEFRPEVWSVDSSGFPTSLISGSPSFLSATSIGWRSVGWSSWTTTVIDEDFLVACICGYSPVSLGMDVPGYSSSFDFNGSSWNAMSDTTYMIRAIVEYNTDCAYYNIHTGWNLVSLPVMLEDSSISSIFPMAAGGLAYYYITGAGYDTTSVIVPGKAYWILSYIDTSFSICGGTPLYTLDVEVEPGWNMVGGTAVPEGYSKYDIFDYPDGTLTSYPYLFGFDVDSRNYIAVDRLYPGKGYFLLAFNSGIIRFEP